MAMYDKLTFRELTVLQSMLYEGTEQAFSIADRLRSEPEWFSRYRPTHSEIAELFIEAATELLDRMELDRIEYEYSVRAA
jgi:hypothetical protein